MRIGDLDPVELRSRLKGCGVVFCSGPFLIRFRASASAAIEPFRMLYSDFEDLDGAPFADFRIRIERVRGIRRWLSPRAIMSFDGKAHFAPFPLHLSAAYFEWGLNWHIASQVQSLMVLHAAAVEREGRAVILPGFPGSGKSTLCAAMACSGWRLLSDELTLLRFDDGKAIPMPRPISLKNDAIPLIRQLAPQVELGPRMRTARKGMVAHVRPPETSIRQAQHPAEPGWIIFPKFTPGAGVESSPLRKGVAFLRVADNSFNYSLLGTFGFEMTGRLIRSSECYELVYGKLSDALTEVQKLTCSE